MDEVYRVENVRDFNLEHIFDCGQCFRWNPEDDGSYTGVAFDKRINVRFAPYDEGGFNGDLFLSPCTEQEYLEIWKDYFDMDRDYGRLKLELAEEDDVVSRAIPYGEGIRILRQDLNEVIFSFIISQNNNIPRIKGCIERLCQLKGERREDRYGEYYTFPSAEVLARLEPEDLAPVRLGYRARYITETARQIMEWGYPKGEADILKFTGVGPKVASCIALFGLGDYASFPVDVWVKRLMNKLYGFKENDVRGMKNFADETFGEMGGIAQQYLFYYIRQVS